jgi:hypothetical protein
LIDFSLIAFQSPDPKQSIDDDTWSIEKSSLPCKSLPKAATCSYSLYLPEYISEEQLRQKMETALEFGSEGFTEV